MKNALAHQTIDTRKYPSEEPDGEKKVDSSEVHALLKKALEKYATKPVMAMMRACVDCGLCAQACHYYCSSGDPELIPSVKFKRLTAMLNKHFPPFGKSGDKGQIPEQELKGLFEASFQNCTMCGKCALSCPMGINTGEILALGRALLQEIGMAPAGLVKPVVESCRKGNYIGLSSEDFIETVEWIAEELAEEFNLEGFSIPIDKPGADVLYVPHPLEVRDQPFLLMYALRILDAAGENYTLSSQHFDTVNYAYYQGNKANMMRIARGMIQAAENMGVRRVVLAPCGHGYRVMRWEAERYLGQKFSFSVYTITELIADYLKRGQLKLKPDTVQGTVTFHDPCNLARRGGVIQQPREIIRAVTEDFVEMEPHGVANYCCGGGGGLAANVDFGKIRMAMGKTKADQIRATKAKIVATGCFNCLTQVRALSQEYNLDIEAKSILELLAYAIV